MKIIETPLEGCLELRPPIFKDARGRLIKTFHQGTFKDAGLELDFKEEYYSVSRKNVLRGLHFQLPPNEHVKCVACLSGRIFDVVIDLRKDSSTYGKHHAVELSSDLGNMLYIPIGFAHGFLSLTDDTIFLNRTTTVYSPESDYGIHWDSCGIKWPNSDPILSQKDIDMIKLSEFKSPF